MHFRSESEPSKCGPPTPGWAWVWNKRDKPFTFTADGVTMTVPGLTAVEVPSPVHRNDERANCAALARKQSIEQIHPEVIRSIAVRWGEGSTEVDDPEFGDILTVEKGIELYDRQADANPMNITAGDGLKTHVAVLNVPGAKALMADRRSLLEIK